MSTFDHPYGETLTGDRAQLVKERAKLLKMAAPSLSDFEASQLASHDVRIDRVAADTGESEVPWRDARPAPIEDLDPTKPDNYERARLRAAAHNLPITEATWRTYAQLGEDCVAMAFAERRRGQLEQLLTARNLFASRVGAPTRRLPKADAL